jgi:hypothetical protein
MIAVAACARLARDLGISGISGIPAGRFQRAAGVECTPKERQQNADSFSSKVFAGSFRSFR